MNKLTRKRECQYIEMKERFSWVIIKDLNMKLSEAKSGKPQLWIPEGKRKLMRSVSDWRDYFTFIGKQRWVDNDSKYSLTTTFA